MTTFLFRKSVKVYVFIPQLAKEFHPDVNKDPGAEKKFQEVSEAYEVSLLRNLHIIPFTCLSENIVLVLIGIVS